MSLVLLLAPLQMAGALCGNVMNRMLPPVTLIIVMVIVLSISDVKTLLKGKALWKKESSKNFISHTYRTKMMKYKCSPTRSTIEMAGLSNTGSKPRLRRMFLRWADYASSKAGEKIILKRYYLRPCFETYFEEKEDTEIELMPLTQNG